MSPPRVLFRRSYRGGRVALQPTAAWGAIRRELRRARQVAVFTDFDGTLAHLRRRPEHARLTPRLRNLLAELARRGAVVGVVSGRRLEDLRAKVGLRGIWYSGAHGHFLASPGNRRIALLDRKEQARIARAGRALARRLRGVPGIGLELKQAALAVHYRNASRRNRELARVAVLAVLEKIPGLRVLAGKKIWEILPDSRAGREVDKWTAIRLVLRLERKRRRGDRQLVVYLGDDTTDESVFRRLDGVSVAIGRRRTAARFLLRSPGETRRFLEMLTALLA